MMIYDLNSCHWFRFVVVENQLDCKIVIGFDSNILKMRPSHYVETSGGAFENQIKAFLVSWSLDEMGATKSQGLSVPPKELLLNKGR